MTISGEGAEADAAAAAMEVEAFKRLYPLQFYERYLESDVRPEGRPLTRARPTSVNLGAHNCHWSRQFAFQIQNGALTLTSPRYFLFSQALFQQQKALHWLRSARR